VIHIDADRCKSCGLCGEVCPRHITETAAGPDGKATVVAQARESLCMQCGHCVAVCPEQAIAVEGLDGEAFEPLRELGIGEEQLRTLLQQRRSVRRYKERPVPREVLGRILSAARLAPTGTSRPTTGIIAIDDPDTLGRLSELAFGVYEGLDKALGNPIGRFLVRRRAGSQTLAMLQDFVMPGVRWYIRWYREGGSNEILRDCPNLVLFHSPIREPMGEANCIIAAFHAVFMAEVLGVGTCMNDLIPPACNRAAGLRELLDLPADREVYASLTLGFPRIRFKRSIPKGLAELRYI